MSSFLVTRERGPAWDHSRSMTDQVAWPEHAAFMNLLVDEGFVVLGGPVGEGERVLLVVSADSEAAIRRRIEADCGIARQVLGDRRHIGQRRIAPLRCHGERDELIPLKEVRKFYGRLSEPKELIEIDAADHLFDGRVAEVGEAIEDLLQDFND